MASNPTGKSVIIIGAGIAGLSAGVYAQMNGYKSRIYELHNLPGGLMTAWKRKGYVIDGCIHWLSGSSPVYEDYYKMWQDIGLIQGREMFDPEVFTRVEGPNGEILQLYTDVNKLEKHLLKLAPEDRAVILNFCKAVRVFTGFMMPSDISGFGGVLRVLPKLPGALRAMPLFMKWAKLTMKDFAGQFKNPFLRQSFHDLWFPEMTAIGLLFTLAMLHNKSAGYPMGGSLPMAHAVEKRYCDLGGEIYYSTRVSRILVENGKAVGVQLTDGREERADLVISAADGHATIFDMLGGQFVDEKIQAMYREGKIFPPLVFSGLGVKRTFKDLYGITGGISFFINDPIEIAGKPIERLEMMIYNFDPSLAPEGKTVLTCMVGSEYAYWKELSAEPERYEAEKERVALEVINRLDRRFPGLAEQVEMADVATPLTFERYTGNWQGSFEGWLPTPQAVMSQPRYTLPGLENFYMIGQWVQPGGGLPSGIMTGKAVVKMMCKKDRTRFRTS